MKNDILKTTAKEYLDSGNEQIEKKRYNSAVILYFKAIVALSDLFILEKTGKVPSSHIKRFKISKENFPEIYEILDKDFPFYQDSYTKIMNQELAEVLEEDAKYISKKIRFEK